MHFWEIESKIVLGWHEVQTPLVVHVLHVESHFLHAAKDPSVFFTL